MTRAIACESGARKDTKMTELEALAVRCEQASEPDREIDAAIFRAIGAPVPFQFANQMVALTFDDAEQCYFAPIGDMRVRYEPPAYTASLDAALTLVPEGSTFYVDSGTNELSGGCHACVWSLANRRLTGGSLDVETPVLALCSAALRAAAASLRAIAGTSQEQEG